MKVFKTFVRCFMRYFAPVLAPIVDAKFLNKDLINEQHLGYLLTNISTLIILIMDRTKSGTMYKHDLDTIHPNLCCSGLKKAPVNVKLLATLCQREAAIKLYNHLKKIQVLLSQSAKYCTSVLLLLTPRASHNTQINFHNICHVLHLTIEPRPWTYTQQLSA